MDAKTLNETSKFLSYVLRHEPQAIDLQLDSEGWADIDALIVGAAKDGRQLDRALGVVQGVPFFTPFSQVFLVITAE